MGKDKFKIGDLVVKTGGRYGGPGRIVGITDDLGAGYKLYAVAMRVEGGYGEFVHVFPGSVLEANVNAAEQRAALEDEIIANVREISKDEIIRALLGRLGLPTLRHIAKQTGERNQDNDN